MNMALSGVLPSVQSGRRRSHDKRITDPRGSAIEREGPLLINTGVESALAIRGDRGHHSTRPIRAADTTVVAFDTVQIVIARRLDLSTCL